MEDTRIKQILHLISLKQEGAYWDFKKEWHSQKSDLLHDIMCFANNLVNSDCYIIIGVDEENDYAVCDIKADPNRKNTDTSPSRKLVLSSISFSACTNICNRLYVRISIPLFL